MEITESKHSRGKQSAQPRGPWCQQHAPTCHPKGVRAYFLPNRSLGPYLGTAWERGWILTYKHPVILLVGKTSSHALPSQGRMATTLGQGCCVLLPLTTSPSRSPFQLFLVWSLPHVLRDEVVRVSGPRGKHARTPTAERQEAGERAKKCSWQFYNISAVARWDGKSLSSHARL